MRTRVNKFNQSDRGPRHATDALVLAEIFDDLVADAVNRVQARHRLLKDHGHAVAHNGATPLSFRQRASRSMPSKRMLPPVDPHSEMSTQQAHDRQGCQALATAAFANNAERFHCRQQLKEHALDDRQQVAPGCTHRDLEVLHFQQCHVIRPPRCRL